MNSSIKMLFLVSTLTVVVLPSSAYSSSRQVSDVTIKNSSDFEHFMTIKSWQATALEHIEDRKKKDKWIADSEHRDSILEVMSKAIADCVKKRNEFEKFWEEHETGFDDFERNFGYILNHLLEFKATPNDVNYNRENWNAFILYSDAV